MKTTWFCIGISAPAAAIDVICATLTDFACIGTVVEQQELDTFVPPDPDLNPKAIYHLQAFFEECPERDRYRDRIAAAMEELCRLNPSWEIRVGDISSVQQQDWAENWKQNFPVQRIGPRLVIKPTWETFEASEQDRVIEIDPGMAFGTGTHGTTLLCLEVVAELFARPHPPVSMLDVGTGSGILSLAAAALGCQQVLGCDIDAEACQVARDNISHNGYGDQIEITSLPLEQLSGTFDLVIANILAEENVRLKHHLLERLAPGGHLILSGILREKEAFVREHFHDPNLQLLPTRYQDDWICLVYCKSED